MKGAKTTLILDMVMCDWLTLTSFGDDLYRQFMKPYEWISQFETVKRMQYDGRQYGSLFIGTAVQHGRKHNLVQVSGAAADEYVGQWSNDDNVRCSRIDVQVTCKAANGMDMFALAERQKGKGRLVGFIESGGLATVYIGSWKSNKFLRIYQKSRNVIRFEACYKGSKANHFHMHIGAIGDVRKNMRGLLKYELNTLGDDALDRLFGEALYGEAVAPKMTPRPESSTEKWILSSVLPALTRYANSHDCDQQIISAIMHAIRQREDSNE